MKKICMLLMVMVAISTVVGCSPDPYVKEVSASALEGQEFTDNIRMYSNNVYYFDFTGENFAKALSKFLEENPELEVASIASDNNAGYGVTTGYIVAMRKHQSSKEDAKEL